MLQCQEYFEPQGYVTGSTAKNEKCFVVNVTGFLSFVSVPIFWSSASVSLECAQTQTKVPDGFRVARYPFDKNDEPTHEDFSVVYENDLATCGSRSCFRPVNAVFNSKGHLYISDDANGEIIKVTYGMPV